MDIYCQVTPTGLVPMYDSDSDLKHHLKLGSVVRCTVRSPRNYKYHKKFWALVRITFDNLPVLNVERMGIRNVEDMLKRFKRDLGYFSSSINDRGEREIEYQSISFSKMEQNEFETFFNECVDLVVYHYLKGIDRDDLLAELENFQ